MQTPRTKRIYDMVKAGMSFNDIAQNHAISAERIRQLYRQHVNHDPEADKAKEQESRRMELFRHIQSRAYSAYKDKNKQKTKALVSDLADMAERM